MSMFFCVMAWDCSNTHILLQGDAECVHQPWGDSETRLVLAWQHKPPLFLFLFYQTSFSPSSSLPRPSAYSAAHRYSIKRLLGKNRKPYGATQGSPGEGTKWRCRITSHSRSCKGTEFLRSNWIYVRVLQILSSHWVFSLCSTAAQRTPLVLFSSLFS